mmetsp:Transcript_13450/g.27831  ORF Transcript_13450/g.27831 Transcript_13450/m.27831 type:complete len:219 (+) Transcript_13450:1769-2425(+)
MHLRRSMVMTDCSPSVRLSSNGDSVYTFFPVMVVSPGRGFSSFTLMLLWARIETIAASSFPTRELCDGGRGDLSKARSFSGDFFPKVILMPIPLPRGALPRPQKAACSTSLVTTGAMLAKKISKGVNCLPLALLKRTRAARRFSSSRAAMATSRRRGNHLDTSSTARMVTMLRASRTSYFHWLLFAAEDLGRSGVLFSFLPSTLLASRVLWEERDSPS